MTHRNNLTSRERRGLIGVVCAALLFLGASIMVRQYNSENASPAAIKKIIETPPANALSNSSEDATRQADTVTNKKSKATPKRARKSHSNKKSTPVASPRDPFQPVPTEF